MALQINTTLSRGVTASECYAKIIEAKYLSTPYPADTPGIRLTVGLYFNKAARDANEMQFIDSKYYIIEDMTKETREDQYAYLKTLDDFTGAIDV